MAQVVFSIQLIRWVECGSEGETCSAFRLKETTAITPARLRLSITILIERGYVL